MTNTILLEQIIKDSGMTRKAIARKMGITPESLRRKIKNKHEFGQGEIIALCKILRLDRTQMLAIFFNQFVA